MSSARRPTPFYNRNSLAWLALLAVALFAYLPNLAGNRVWDDVYLIGRNPFFRSPVFVFEVFRHYLYPESISLYYRPVQNLSYILDYWLWNENTAGYHLSNILLHGFAGCLLFVLLRRVLPPLLEGTAMRARSGVLAWLVALVWVVHPIHHAAVAYIAGRADSLAAVLSLSAWLIYLRDEMHSQPWKLAGLGLVSGGLFLLALCAKEIAAVWLALFAGWLLFFRQPGQRFRRVLPLLLLGLVLGAYWYLRQLLPYREAPPGMQELGWPGRLMLMLRALGDYARLLVFPSELHMERTVISTAGYRNAAEWEALVGYEFLALLGMLVIVGALWLTLRRTPGRHLRLFGLFWFTVGFLPISNLIPLVATVAEHWIYMPSIGAFLFVGGCAAGLPERWHRAAGILVLAVATALGIRTALKVGDWRDNETFFRSAIAATGGSARMRANLASVYSERGDLAEAERQLREALALHPNSSMILTNLGVVLLGQGRSQEALSFLAGAEKSADRVPWKLAVERAKALGQQGQKTEALAVLRDAQTRFPEIWQLCAEEARLVSELEGAAAAVPVVERYTKAFWWNYGAHLYLGDLQQAAGNVEEALRAWRDAARLDIHAAEPFIRSAKL